MENEVWLPVVGYEGLYEVSSLGRVKRVGQTILDKTGKRKTVRECIRVLTPDRKGYLYATVFRHNKGFCLKAHRAVTQAFIPNPLNKPQVNHIDNDPANNRVENLEWCTPKENTAHMLKQGRARNKFMPKLQ